MSDSFYRRIARPLFILPFLLPITAAAQHKPPKVGLALSGGGARGAAHIGVLKVLEREHIPIDCIAGTSFGAIVGGLYAIGYSADEIDQIFQSQDWSYLFSDAPRRSLSPLLERKTSRYMGQVSFKGFSPELPSGLIVGQKMAEVFDSLTTERLLAAHYDFDRLPIPFRAVATNLVDGKAYVFKQGRMSEALRASISIPLIFTPVSKDGMLLADGGLADNFPTDIVRSMGADIIIAVDVTSPLLTEPEIQTFVNVLDQSLSLLMIQSVERNRSLADLIIKPPLDGYTFGDYGMIRAIEKLGEQEAEKRLGAVKALVSGIPYRAHVPWAPPPRKEIIASISFEGLEHVKASQLRGDIRSRMGQPVSVTQLSQDVSRLYATRLFDHVDYDLLPLGEDRYHLVFLMKEAPLHTLGASIRYDNDYNFVALAEFTAHQLFGTPSAATLSSQFGGIENHVASLRYVPPGAGFLFVQPSVHLRRRTRSDIRNQVLVDEFTVKHSGGELMIGGLFFKRLEVSAGYLADRAAVSGGALPNRLEGAQRIAGTALRINRDTLDRQEFPSGGMSLRAQVEKRSKQLGSDLSYSKWQGDVERYFSPTGVSTFRLRAGIGLSRGEVPFYDQFFLGGNNFSDGGPVKVFGLSADEFIVRQYALISASYRRQVFSRPLSFIRHGYLQVFYNLVGYSNRDAAPYNTRLFNGAGVGLALDTMLGPVRLAGGWGESGRIKLYLTLGPSF
jgi:NTE family protein